MIVGKFATAADVSAVATGSQITLTITSLISSLAMGMTIVQGIAGAFLVQIPVAFVMSRQTPVSLFHVGLATPCSTFLQILLCFACFAFWWKKQYKKQYK